MTPMPYGLRVVGGKSAERRLVDWRAALAGYAACDAPAEVEREGFLSHFVYGPELKSHLDAEGSERGFDGPCGADWLFFDLDRPNDLDAALGDARRLYEGILARYPELDEDDPLAFYSGSKGFHVGISTHLWNPGPSSLFHATARRSAERLAERAGIAIDSVVYSKTRLFRAPNSKHPKTGLFKRRLSYGELMHLSAEAILDRARRPEPFELPAPTATSPTARDDWREAEGAVERRVVERRASYPADAPRLNALTLTFIKEGADEGERADRLFQAAANLGEFDCPPPLAHALLTEPGRDAGLTPSETERQIDCGLAHARRRREGGAS